MNKRSFISWRRVSTKKQGRSGLGLDAQESIIRYFVENEGGVLIDDYCEVYTGTELSGCVELRKAIAKCKETGATLIIAKTDRFRSTLEALNILEEVGENNIFFCDLPHTDKFTLTLFFAIAEREALLIGLRTKAALKAKKEREGSWAHLYGKNTGTSRKESLSKASKVSGKNRNRRAQTNEHNVFFWKYVQSFCKRNGYSEDEIDFRQLTDELVDIGAKTSSGLPFNISRTESMYKSLKNIYKEVI